MSTTLRSPFVHGFRGLAWLAQAVRCERASALLEFAALTPIMTALSLGAMQLGSIYFAESELQRVTRLASRLVMVGGATAMTQSQFKTTLCASIAAVLDCNRIYISLQPQPGCASIDTTPLTLQFDSNGDVTNALPYNPGSSASVMVLQVAYLEPVIGLPMMSFATSNGFMPLYSTFVFFNEPF